MIERVFFTCTICLNSLKLHIFHQPVQRLVACCGTLWHVPHVTFGSYPFCSILHFLHRGGGPALWLRLAPQSSSAATPQSVLVFPHRSGARLNPASMGIASEPKWVRTVEEGLPGTEDAACMQGLQRTAEGEKGGRAGLGKEVAVNFCFQRRVPVYLLPLTVVMLLAIIAVIFSAVLKSSQCPDQPFHAASRAENLKNSEVLQPCGDEWIWFRKKCYFFSQVEANWDAAEHACASWNSSLAVIENKLEMDFIRRYIGEIDHWIGLRRDSGQAWKWVNGSEFSNWFMIYDYSDCAFLNGVAGSSGCYSKLNWICTTKERFDVGKRKKRSLTSSLFLY